MDMISLHMNATQGGANMHPRADLYPGVFLHPGANTANEHGLRLTTIFQKSIQVYQNNCFNNICKGC